MLLSELFKPEPEHNTLHGFKIMSLEQFVYSKLYESVEVPVEDVSDDKILIKNEFGDELDFNVLEHSIKARPKQLLKHNTKISKNLGITLFDVGLPAMMGLIVNENTDELVIVNTCATTGKCRTYCYVLNDGNIQYPEVFLPLSNKVNYLVNDSHGFEHKIVKEIHSKLSMANKQGATVAVRWHDVGDFFSEAYMDMAVRIAKKFPTVDFYAYTKLGVVSSKKGIPSNFHAKLSSGKNINIDKPDITVSDLGDLLKHDGPEKQGDKNNL